jgi:hypothetical protein
MDTLFQIITQVSRWKLTQRTVTNEGLRMTSGFKEVIKKQAKTLIKGNLPTPVYQAGVSVLHRSGLVKKMVQAAATTASLSGQIQTAFREKPYDHKGRPFLWYSTSMGYFFKTIDFRDKTILEFGAGHSTLWWARHAKSVTAIEDGEEWYDYLAPIVPENVELVRVTDDPNVALEAVKGRKFDLIIVDCNGGVLERDVCNEWSVDLVAENGAILFDNSEEDYYKHDSIPMFYKKGFRRVDFYGIGATKTTPQCSSIHFKGDCFLWEGKHLPAKIAEFDDDTLAHTPFEK